MSQEEQKEEVTTRKSVGLRPQKIRYMASQDEIIEEESHSLLDDTSDSNSISVHEEIKDDLPHVNVPLKSSKQSRRTSLTKKFRPESAENAFAQSLRLQLNRITSQETESLSITQTKNDGNKLTTDMGSETFDIYGTLKDEEQAKDQMLTPNNKKLPDLNFGDQASIAIQIKNFKKIHDAPTNRMKRRGSVDRLIDEEEEKLDSPHKQQKQEAIINIHKKLIDNFHDEFDWDANQANNSIMQSPADSGQG